MTWPSTDVNTTNVDAATDSPASARADLLDLMAKFNLLRNHVSTFFQGLLSSVDAQTARLALGAAKSGVCDNITDFQALTAINGGALAGYRNRLINGDMRIDQRNRGASITPAASVYTVDRFKAVIGAASKLSFQQVLDAPPGFLFSMKIAVVSQYAPAAGDSFSFYQAIEGQNVVDLNIGAASANAVTVSFWVKGSVAGTYSGSLVVNGSAPYAYPFTYPVTASWVKQIVTIPLPTSLAAAFTSIAAGLILHIDTGSGTTRKTTPLTWTAGSTFYGATGSVALVNQVNTSSLNVTGFQLEVGSAATVYEARSYGQELQLCQRYCWAPAAPEFSGPLAQYAHLYSITYSSAAGQQFQTSLLLPQPMRSTATVVSQGQTANNANTSSLNMSGLQTVVLSYLSNAAGLCTVTYSIESVSAEL